MTNVTKSTAGNNICQHIYISTQGFGRFLYNVLISLIMLILILVESNQYWCSNRKMPNQPNSNF